MLKGAQREAARNKTSFVKIAADEGIDGAQKHRPPAAVCPIPATRAILTMCMASLRMFMVFLVVLLLENNTRARWRTGASRS